MDEDKIIKGVWNDIHRPAKTPEIKAKYDRIKDWEMDPSGYFLIRVERDADLIRAAFCTLSDHTIKAEVTGKTALEIVNTLIRKEMVSTLQHAADLGVELHKAEVALRHGLEYVQDNDLNLQGGNFHNCDSSAKEE